MNHELQPSVNEGVVHSVTRIPIIGVDSGAGVPVEPIQRNDSSNYHYPLPINQDHPINTTSGTSKQAMTASLPANGSYAVMTNSSVNSNVVYQPANDNNDTNLKTPTSMAPSEIGNQIGENGGSSSGSSSQLKRKLNSDETYTTTCVSQNKTSPQLPKNF